ncbi:MAG: dTDP-4-dehydrorhamnose 3,5-epimerase [Flavobacteriaceae bacterium]
MQIEKTFIDGLLVLTPRVFKDKRGYFMESFNKEKVSTLITCEFVQDNESLSGKGVLRGLHFQKPPFSQDKLVRVIKGSVLDVVVDLRKDSSTYGKHFAIKLSAKNKKQLFVPKGFAHGFLTLKKNTLFSYKCSAYYNVASEVGIDCFDENLAIDWPIKNVKLSIKDENGLKFSSFESPF